MQQHYLECQKAQWSNLGYGNLLSCSRGKKFPEDRRACKDCREFKPYEIAINGVEFLTGLKGEASQCQS